MRDLRMKRSMLVRMQLLLDIAKLFETDSERMIWLSVGLG